MIERNKVIYLIIFLQVFLITNEMYDIIVDCLMIQKRLTCKPKRCFEFERNSMNFKMEKHKNYFKMLILQKKNYLNTWLKVVNKLIKLRGTIHAFSLLSGLWISSVPPMDIKDCFDHMLFSFLAEYIYDEAESVLHKHSNFVKILFYFFCKLITLCFVVVFVFEVPSQIDQAIMSSFMSLFAELAIYFVKILLSKRNLKKNRNAFTVYRNNYNDKFVSHVFWLLLMYAVDRQEHNRSTLKKVGLSIVLTRFVAEFRFLRDIKGMSLYLYFCFLYFISYDRVMNNGYDILLRVMGGLILSLLLSQVLLSINRKRPSCVNVEKFVEFPIILHKK